jgi:hypothetical protein
METDPGRRVCAVYSLEMTMKITRIGDNVFGATAVATTVLLSPVVRRWYNHWGADRYERRRRLPGDSRVPQPRLQYTRAVTIHAPASIVWAYVVQIGQEHAGLYSYEGLENLAGCAIRNADHIVLEWQQVQVGDKVRLGPKGYPVYKVVSIEPGRALVMAGADPKTETVTEIAEPRENYTNFVWSIIVETLYDHITRLISRARLDYSPEPANEIMWHFFEPVNFVMERKMMLTIKRLAERDYTQALA